MAFEKKSRISYCAVQGSQADGNVGTGFGEKHQNGITF